MARYPAAMRRRRKWPGRAGNEGEIETIAEVAEDLTSRPRHSLLLQDSRQFGKLLIPLVRACLERAIRAPCASEAETGSP